MRCPSTPITPHETWLELFWSNARWFLKCAMQGYCTTSPYIYYACMLQLYIHFNYLCEIVRNCCLHNKCRVVQKSYPFHIIIKEVVRYTIQSSTHVKDFVPRWHNIHTFHFLPAYHNEGCIQLSLQLEHWALGQSAAKCTMFHFHPPFLLKRDSTFQWFHKKDLASHWLKFNENFEVNA